MASVEWDETATLPELRRLAANTLKPLFSSTGARRYSAPVWRSPERVEFHAKSDQTAIDDVVYAWREKLTLLSRQQQQNQNEIPDGATKQAPILSKAGREGSMGVRGDSSGCRARAPPMSSAFASTCGAELGTVDDSSVAAVMGEWASSQEESLAIALKVYTLENLALMTAPILEG